MKTKAMNESWVLIKNYKMNKSDALKQGWLLAKNHHAMRTRKYVMFEFLKTDGKTIRKALGTLHPYFVPPTKRIANPTDYYASILRCEEERLEKLPQVESSENTNVKSKNEFKGVFRALKELDKVFLVFDV